MGDCANLQAYFLLAIRSFLFSFLAFSVEWLGDIPEQPCFLDRLNEGTSLEMRAVRRARGPHGHSGAGTGWPSADLLACVSVSSSCFGARL